jgi:hypothetical protein
MTTSEVAWAPGPNPYVAPGGWPPPARPGPDPAALLRTLGGALAGVAGALTAGSTFLTYLSWESTDDLGRRASRVTGWGLEATFDRDDAIRQLLLGIPLVAVAAALLVAASLVLLSVRRPDRRPRGTTAMVGAAGAATAATWVVGSSFADSVRFYRELDIDGLSMTRGSGWWLLLTGFVLAIFALAAVLVAALLDSPRRRAHVAAAPPAPDAAALYAPGPYAAPGQWAPAPTAPPAWPAPAPSPWGETR